MTQPTPRGANRVTISLPVLAFTLFSLIPVPCDALPSPSALDGAVFLSGPAQSPSASFSDASNPIRVTVGASVSVGFSPKNTVFSTEDFIGAVSKADAGNAFDGSSGEVGEAGEVGVGLLLNLEVGDLVAFVPPGSKDCGACLSGMDEVDSAGIVDGKDPACEEPGLFLPVALKRYAGDDSGKYKGMLYAEVTPVDSGDAVREGMSMLCVRRKISSDPMNPKGGSGNVYSGWQFYGDAVGISVIRITKIDRGTFYAGQHVPEITISGSNLRANDVISLGNEDGSCDSKLSASSSHIAPLTVPTGTGVGSTGKATAFVPTKPNSASGKKFTICWAAEGSAIGKHMATSLRIDVRDLTAPLGLHFTFPRAFIASNDKIPGETKIRFGGWNIRDGDKLAIGASFTDCRSVDANSMKVGEYQLVDGKFHTAFTTFPANTVIDDNADNMNRTLADGVPMLVHVCYYPVGLDVSKVPASYDGANNNVGDNTVDAGNGNDNGFRHVPVYAVTATDCAAGGNSTETPSASVLISNDFSNSDLPAALPREVPMTLFVSGCVRTNDEYGLAAAAGDCATATDVDYFGTSGEAAYLAISDASWPRLASVKVRGGAAAGGKLCRKRDGAYAKVGDLSYATVGSTGKTTPSSDAFVVPSSIMKPLWVMAGEEMPLATEITALAVTESNAEFVLMTGHTSEECASTAINTRQGSANSVRGPYADNVGVMQMASGGSMNFFVGADEDVAASRTVTLCMRINLGAYHSDLASPTDPGGLTPWMATSMSILQHPALKRFPDEAAPLPVAGQDRTGFVTFSGVLPDDNVAYSDLEASEGECQTATRAERQPIGLTREAHFTRTDGTAMQFANTSDSAPNYLCVSRTGDSRSYLFSTQKLNSPSAIATRTALTLDGFPSAIYAKTPRDIPISSGVLYRGDQVGIATSASGCTASAGGTIVYAETSFTYGKSATIKGFEFGEISTPVAGDAAICVLRLGLTVPVEYQQKVRVARVESTYHGASGTAANRAILVDKYLSFLAHGDSTVDIWFRGRNIGSDDRVAFALTKADGGSGCSGLGAPGVFPKTTSDGQNRKIDAADVTGKFNPPTRGGEFELCYRACTTAACTAANEVWAETGKTMIVVRVTMVSPGEIITADPGKVYLTGEGIAKGDLAYMLDSTSEVCSSNRNSNPPSPDSHTTPQRTVSETSVPEGSAAGTSSVKFIPFLAGDFQTVAQTYEKLCYVPQGTAQHSSSAFASFTTSGVSVKIPSERSNSQVVKIDPADLIGSPSTVRVFSGVPTDVSLIPPAGAVAALQEGYAVRFVKVATSTTETTACSAISGSDASASELDSPVVKDPVVIGRFTVSANLKIDRSTDATDPGRYVACYRRFLSDATSMAKATYVPVGGGTSLYAAKATGVSPKTIYVGSSTARTYTITGAEGLSTSDTVCFVKRGSAAPKDCALDASSTGSRVYAVDSAGKFTISTGHFSADQEWDLYLQTGGAKAEATNSISYTSKPVLIAGQGPKAPAVVTAFTGMVSLAIKTMPTKVVATEDGGASLDARRILLGNAIAPGDLVWFTTSSSVCTGAAAAAMTVSSERSVLVSAEFATTNSGATLRVCARSARDHDSSSSAKDEDFVLVPTATVTVATTPSFSISDKTKIVQAGAPQVLVLDGTVQPGDTVRIIKGKTNCGDQGSNDDSVGPLAKDVSTKLSFSLSGAYTTIEIPRNSPDVANSVCYRPAAPPSKKDTWYTAGVGATALNVARAVPIPSDIAAGGAGVPGSNANLHPTATATKHQLTFTIKGSNIVTGDFAALVNADDTDCRLAWKTEAMVVSEKGTASTGMTKSGTFSISVPPGRYRLCYAPLGTATYVPYKEVEDSSVRSVGVAVIGPSFASDGLATTFEIAEERTGSSSTSDSAEAGFVKGDMIALVPAGSGNCNPPSPAESYYRGFVNVSFTAPVGGIPRSWPSKAISPPAESSSSVSSSIVVPTLTEYPLAGLKVGRMYRVCAKLLGGPGSTSMSTVASTAQRLGAVSGSAVVGTTEAVAAVNAYRVPVIGETWPRSIRSSADRSKLTIHGAFLDGRDIMFVNTSAPITDPTASSFAASASICDIGRAAANITMGAPNATNGLSTVVTAGGESIVPSDVKPGRYPVCYLHHGSNVTTKVPVGPAEHGVTINVVDVSKIAPTGSYVTSGSSTVKITFTGYFDADVAGDFVALLPSKDSLGETTRNCSMVDLARDARPVVLTSATTGEAVVNATHVSDEYVLCFRFGGTKGNAGRSLHLAKVGNTDGGSPDANNGFSLLDPKRFIFSSRRIDTFSPTLVANGTSQALTIHGAGVRSGDQVVAVPVAARGGSATAADCVRVAAVVTNIFQVKVSDRDRTFKRGTAVVKVPSGHFRLCYRFAAPEVPAGDWRVISYSTLSSTEAAVVAVSAAAIPARRGLPLAFAPKAKNDPSRASSVNFASTIDPADSVVLLLEGAGISVGPEPNSPGGDAAMLVNASLVVNGSCAAVLANTWSSEIRSGLYGQVTPWSPVLRVDPARYSESVIKGKVSPARGSYGLVVIPAGQLRGGTDYAVCYKFSDPVHSGVVAAMSVYGTDNSENSISAAVVNGGTVVPMDSTVIKTVYTPRVISLFPKSAGKSEVLNTFDHGNGTTPASKASYNVSVPGNVLNESDLVSVTAVSASATFVSCSANDAAFAAATPVDAVYSVDADPSGNSAQSTYTFTLASRLAADGVAGSVATVDVAKRILAGSSTGELPAADRTTYRVCYYFKGDRTKGVEVDGGFVLGASCEATVVCGVDPLKPFRCGCECQATPCKADGSSSSSSQSRCASGFPGFFDCEASGMCVRSPSMCPSVGRCDSGIRCPQGACAPSGDSLSGCGPIDECPSFMKRCLDGSCSANGCVGSDGVNITVPICPAGKTACPIGVCPAVDGSCPKFNGCPPTRPFRCGDTCKCAKSELHCPAGSGVAAPSSSSTTTTTNGTATTTTTTTSSSSTAACTSPDFPIPCIDGTCAARHSDCRCRRYDGFSDQELFLRTKVAPVSGSSIPSRRSYLTGRRSKTRRARPRRFKNNSNNKDNNNKDNSNNNVIYGYGNHVDEDGDTDTFTYPAVTTGSSYQRRSSRRRSSTSFSAVETKRFEINADVVTQVWLSPLVIVEVPAGLAGADNCVLELNALADSEVDSIISHAGGTFDIVASPVLMRLVTRGNSTHSPGLCPLASNTTGVTAHWREWDTRTEVSPGCATVVIPPGIFTDPEIDAPNGTVAAKSTLVDNGLACTITGEWTLTTAVSLRTGLPAAPVPSPSPIPSPSPWPSPTPYPSAPPTASPSPTSAGPTPISAADTIAPARWWFSAVLTAFLILFATTT